MMRHYLLALLLAASLRSGAQAQAVDLSTPEAAIRSFVACANRGDYKSAVGCVRGATYDLGAASAEGWARQYGRRIELKRMVVIVSGKKAEGALTVAWQYGGDSSALTARDTLDLAKGADGWQIVLPAPEAAGAAAPKPRAVLSDVVADLLQHDVLGRALAKARATRCLSSVKTVCVGLLQYAVEYDERFELTPSTMAKKIEPYLLQKVDFACSDDSGAAPYTFNEKLAGKSLAAVKHPASTVLVYEGAKGKLAYRHFGFAMVGFVDGHAKAVSVPEAKDLRWNP